MRNYAEDTEMRDWLWDTLLNVLTVLVLILVALMLLSAFGVVRHAGAAEPTHMQLRQEIRDLEQVVLLLRSDMANAVGDALHITTAEDGTLYRMVDGERVEYEPVRNRISRTAEETQGLVVAEGGLTRDALMQLEGALSSQINRMESTEGGALTRTAITAAHEATRTVIAKEHEMTRMALAAEAKAAAAHRAAEVERWEEQDIDGSIDQALRTLRFGPQRVSVAAGVGGAAEQHAFAAGVAVNFHENLQGRVTGGAGKDGRVKYGAGVTVGF